MLDQLAFDAPSIVVDGSLLLAVPLAFLAGLVSFLSPCVLPLAPGYLAYVAGLTGADLADTAQGGRGARVTGDQGDLDSVVDVRAAASDTATVAGASTVGSLSAGGARSGGAAGAGSATTGGPAEADLSARGAGSADAGLSADAVVPVDSPPVTPAKPSGRGRVLAGATLFVLGFSAVFVSYGVLFGGLGAWLLTHQREIGIVMGLIVVVLGLGYLGLPALSNRMWWNADRRSHARPSRGLWGAPLLGVLFGLGWTPCIGPTLAAVQTLAFTEASATRGAILSLAYCLGLGLPFIGMAVGLRAVAGATAWTRKHYLGIARFGGVMLIAIGLLLITGWWNDIVAWLQGLIPGFTAVV